MLNLENNFNKPVTLMQTQVNQPNLNQLRNNSHTWFFDCTNLDHALNSQLKQFYQND